MNWAMIFGASGDIGSQVARDLADRGWSLYLHYYRNRDRISELAAELAERHPAQDFIVLQYDMTDAENVSSVCDAVFGTLNAVIFSEGTTFYSLFSELSPENLDLMITMQLRTPLRIVQSLEKRLARADFGRIVFVGSVYGGAGSAMEVGYSTVKGALSAFSRAYAKEVASLGITVNVVAPGAVDTQMNSIFSLDEKEEVDSEIPIGRFASPAEISYWVTTLLDKKAGYMTGQTLYATGGWLK